MHCKRVSSTSYLGVAHRMRTTPMIERFRAQLQCPSVHYSCALHTCQSCRDQVLAALMLPHPRFADNDRHGSRSAGD